jgi:Rrf2 family transcriptional regulator, iron-sulfur cluster assembly transcription factor
MERLTAGALARAGSVRNPYALAAETGLSVPGLNQVVHFLQRAGLVKQNPSGGVRLARPATEISVLAVVRAIDGAGLWGRCLLGLAECTDDAPCPAHPAWKKARRMLERHLESQSIADLTRAVAQRRRARNLRRLPA